MGLVLAVDPGRQKTGLALVTDEGRSLGRSIVETATCLVSLEAFLQSCGRTPSELSAIVCGDGTHHGPVGALLGAWAEGKGLDFSFVEEAYSTVEGRALYWEEQPPKGWRALVPRSWLTVPVPVDDYTAEVLGRRYWQRKEGSHGAN